MKLEDLESILATVAESCERLDQRLRSAKDAYERMNHLAHQQLWSQPSECQQLELELAPPEKARCCCGRRQQYGCHRNFS